MFKAPVPLLAHLSRKIEYSCSDVCRCSRCPQCSNVFLSVTTGPIKAKLHVEGGTKVCINGPALPSHDQDGRQGPGLAINSKNL